MADNETIADIIAEMCGGPIPQHRRDQELLHHYADRLEAAWKREKAEVEANALTVGGVVEASRKRVLSKTRENDNSGAAIYANDNNGDAAKLREALVSVKKSIDEMGAASLDGDSEIMLMSLTQVCARLSARIDAALAAPPRNCDLARDWLQDLYCKFKPPASVGREMPPEWVDAVMAFCRWLVAQAKDTKGENDANK